MDAAQRRVEPQTTAERPMAPSTMGTQGQLRISEISMVEMDIISVL